MARGACKWLNSRPRGVALRHAAPAPAHRLAATSTLPCNATVSQAGAAVFYMQGEEPGGHGIAAPEQKTSCVEQCGREGCGAAAASPSAVVGRSAGKEAAHVNRELGGSVGGDSIERKGHWRACAHTRYAQRDRRKSGAAGGGQCAPAHRLERRVRRGCGEERPSSTPLVIPLEAALVRDFQPLLYLR